jgi:DNA-binding NtrC family response regulator
LILEDIDAASPRTRGMLDRYLSSGTVWSVGTFGPGTAVDTRVVATETSPPVGAHAPFHADPWSPPGLTRLLVPSLRERDADIPLLAQFFASVDRHHGGAVFSAEAIRALTRYSWPGNVTQLRRVVERLANAGVANPIQPRDLPVGIRPRPEGSAPKRSLSVGERLFLNVQATGASFWAAVYPLFMKREITRADVRDLMGRALDTARGNRDELPRVLNLPSSDGEKLTRFLRKYGCDPVA